MWQERGVSNPLQERICVKGIRGGGEGVFPPASKNLNSSPATFEIWVAVDQTHNFNLFPKAKRLEKLLRFLLDENVMILFYSQ